MSNFYGNIGPPQSAKEMNYAPYQQLNNSGHPPRFLSGQNAPQMNLNGMKMSDQSSYLSNGMLHYMPSKFDNQGYHVHSNHYNEAMLNYSALAGSSHPQRQIPLPPHHIQPYELYNPHPPTYISHCANNDQSNNSGMNTAVQSNCNNPRNIVDDSWIWDMDTSGRQGDLPSTSSNSNSKVIIHAQNATAKSSINNSSVTNKRPESTMSKNDKEAKDSKYSKTENLTKAEKLSFIPKKPTMRALSLPLKNVNSLQRKIDLQTAEVLFELIGSVVEPITYLNNNFGVQFVLSDDIQVKQKCVFYDIDACLPKLVTNKRYCCVGKLLKNNLFQCFNMMQLNVVEEKICKAFEIISEHEINDLYSNLPEK